MADNTIKIGGELESMATGKIVAAASAIKDKSRNKTQEVINGDVEQALSEQSEQFERLSEETAESVASAENSAKQSKQYLADLKEAITDLPDGQAVSAQVAINQVDIAGLKSDIVVNLSTRYNTSYANLSAALTALNSDTATDVAAIKKAGVSIKFINSTTNKYEQWDLKASSWSTNTSDWALYVDGSVANGKLKLPFELEKPSSNEYVTQASEIGYGDKALDEELTESSDNIRDIKNKVQDVQEEGFHIADGSGNEILRYDGNGFDAALVSEHLKELINEGKAESINTSEDGLFFVDSQMNIVAKIDSEGINTIGRNNSGVDNGGNDALGDLRDNMSISYQFDAESNANYLFIRVFRDKIDGSSQYPHVIYEPRSTALEVAKKYKNCLVINAGIFDVSDNTPDGVVITKDGIIHDGATTTHNGCKPLVIDKNGNLSAVASDTTASSLVSQRVHGAVTGFVPIIENFEAVEMANNVDHYTQNAQRQIFGQFDNGDYGILTCEGRGGVASDGWTMAEAQAVCIKWGFKFAYNFDGGGSTETAFNQKQLNHVYEGNSGRKDPTFILFNGKTTY